MRLSGAMLRAPERQTPPGEKVLRVCKPNSVSGLRRDRIAIIYLVPFLRAESSDLPVLLPRRQVGTGMSGQPTSGRRAEARLSGQTGLTWSCSEQGLSTLNIAGEVVSSYLSAALMGAKRNSGGRWSRRRNAFSTLSRRRSSDPDRMRRRPLEIGELSQPGRYIFCDTFRCCRLSPAVPPLSRGALSCGVRTFLPADAFWRDDCATRSSGTFLPCLWRF